MNLILFFKTDTIENTLKKKVEPQLTALRDEFDDPVSNKTMIELLLVALQSMKQNTSIAVNKSIEMRKPLTGISLAGAIGMGEKIEQLRWPVTMAVLSALLVLCVVLLVGVARHSRCVLITYVLHVSSFHIINIRESHFVTFHLQVLRVWFVRGDSLLADGIVVPCDFSGLR